jgi:hypothetical protein
VGKQEMNTKYWLEKLKERSVGRPKRRLVDNIKTDLGEIRCED